MTKLLGGFWRLLVGIKDGLALVLLLLFFVALYAALSATPNRTVTSGALLLQLDGTIVEQPAETDPLAVLTSAGPALREYRLRDVLHALDTAASDDRVKVVVLDLERFLGGGQVAIGAVGEALDRVRRAGKPVLAYATGYTDDGYQLAAHASEIWMNPLGAVALAGPGGSQLYFPGLLDRLGVTAHVYRVGTYKAAVEPFLRTDQSPEARRANEAVTSALWESWRQDVRTARPKAQLDRAIADPIGRGDLSRTALAYGMVDKLAPQAEFAKRVAAIAGADRNTGDFRTIRFADWIEANPLRSAGGAIGVVTVAGDIVDGEAGPGTAGAETIARLIREGLAKRDLKALVVRIDSPGGSVLASERIRLAVLEAKQKGLPVVVSMGSVAASGGYWIATAGDRIFAEPATITGSIGVFGVLPSFEQSLAKIGISTDGVRTTPLSGQPDLAGGFTPEFNRLAQTGVEDAYGRFLRLVADARRLPVARVDEIAQGRIWTGGMARQIGLVDQFGGFQEAIAEAARRAKLEPAAAGLVFLEKEPDWISRFLRDWNRPGEDQRGADLIGRMAARQQAVLASSLADAMALARGASIQARCLECATALPPRSIADPGGLFRRLVAMVAG
mgnify:CR=1 FL=1